MSKLFSSGPAKSESPASPVPTKKSSMKFFPAKGLGSYHCFGATGDKGKKLFRSAVLQYGSLTLGKAADEEVEANSINGRPEPVAVSLGIDEWIKLSGAREERRQGLHRPGVLSCALGDPHCGVALRYHQAQ